MPSMMPLSASTSATVLFAPRSVSGECCCQSKRFDSWSPDSISLRASCGCRTRCRLTDRRSKNRQYEEDQTIALRDRTRSGPLRVLSHPKTSPDREMGQGDPRCQHQAGLIKPRGTRFRYRTRCSQRNGLSAVTIPLQGSSVRPPSACLWSQCDRESCRDRASRSERHSRSAD